MRTSNNTQDLPQDSEGVTGRDANGNALSTVIQLLFVLLF